MKKYMILALCIGSWLGTLHTSATQIRQQVLTDIQQRTIASKKGSGSAYIPAVIPVTITYNSAVQNIASDNAPGATTSTMSFTVTGTIISSSVVTGNVPVTVNSGTSANIPFSANVSGSGSITIEGSGLDHNNGLVIISGAGTLGNNTTTPIDIQILNCDGATYFAGYTLTGAQYTLKSFTAPSGTYPYGGIGLQTVVRPTSSYAAITNFIVGIDDTSGNNPDDFSSVGFSYSGSDNLFSYNPSSYAYENTSIEEGGQALPYGPVANNAIETAIRYMVPAGAYFTDMLTAIMGTSSTSINLMTTDSFSESPPSAYNASGNINAGCLTMGYTSNVASVTTHLGNSSILCAVGSNIELFNTNSTTNDATGSTGSSLASELASHTSTAYIAHGQTITNLACSKGACTFPTGTLSAGEFGDYAGIIYVLDESSNGTITAYSAANSGSLPLASSTKTFSTNNFPDGATYIAPLLVQAGQGALFVVFTGAFDNASIYSFFPINGNDEFSIIQFDTPDSGNVTALATPNYTSGTGGFNGTGNSEEDIYFVTDVSPTTIFHIHIPSGNSYILDNATGTISSGSPHGCTFSTITPTFPCGNGNITNLGVQFGTTTNTPAIGILYT